MPNRRPLLERFWEKVRIGAPNECWEWIAYRNAAGYGTICVEGCSDRAHRVSWVFYHGKPIPLGMFVLHTCDNRACVNPHHLILGTQADNLHDMVHKARHPRGTHNGSAKLSEDDVKEIVSLAYAGELSHSQLANHYGVHQCTITAILTGRNWGWFTDIKPRYKKG